MKTNEGKGIYPLDFMYEQAGLVTYCCELSHAKQLERRSLKKSPDFFFQASSFQLLKLENLLR